MFFRQKKSGNRVYLQIVENRWEDGRSKQRVIATLGRLDQLQQTGQLEGLLRSGAKFCESVLLLAAHRRDLDSGPKRKRTFAGRRRRTVIWPRSRSCPARRQGSGCSTGRL